MITGWFEKDGKLIYMRSLWEINYAHYLNFLVKHKNIIKWEYEPDVFWFHGIKRGTNNYKPDFKIYNNDGTIEYHEVKGYMDAKSRTKIRRMAMHHPKVRLIVVDEEGYKAITKVRAMIPNWGKYIKDNPNVLRKDTD